MSRPLSPDTSAEVERRQIEGWRRLRSDEKAEIVTALTTMSIDLTMAGLRHRHPAEPMSALRQRLATILLGPDLARHVRPGVDASERALSEE